MKDCEFCELHSKVIIKFHRMFWLKVKVVSN